jgi:hypothetical protein
VSVSSLKLVVKEHEHNKGVGKELAGPEKGQQEKLKLIYVNVTSV